MHQNWIKIIHQNFCSGTLLHLKVTYFHRNILTLSYNKNTYLNLLLCSVEIVKQWFADYQPAVRFNYYSTRNMARLYISSIFKTDV